LAFDYYKKLSAADRRIYKRSDHIVEVRLPNAERLRKAVSAIERAMLEAKRPAVELAASDLCTGIARALGAPPVRVKVLAKRPRQAGGELHGLYTLSDDGRALIEIWMRTAAHKRVVAFRTFLRTLLHEVCHHLDFTIFGLAESFHTEGFFRRESSLFRQLAPARAASRRTAKAAEQRQSPEAGKPAAARGAPAPKQLSLFDT
jgi:hypothetical protein